MHHLCVNTEIVHVGEALAAILARLLVVALVDVTNVSAQRSRVLEDVTALLEKRVNHILNTHSFLSFSSSLCLLIFVMKINFAPQSLTVFQICKSRSDLQMRFQVHRLKMGF